MGAWGAGPGRKIWLVDASGNAARNSGGDRRSWRWREEEEATGRGGGMRWRQGKEVEGEEDEEEEVGYG
eukprot:9504187-Pyramimonas_sp.AAC.4